MILKEESFIVRVTFPTGEIKDAATFKYYPENDEVDRIVSTSLNFNGFKECSVDIVKKLHYIIKEETK